MRHHRERGKVKWFNIEKGYGFIQRHKGQDIFVHESDIKQRSVLALHTGQVVEFRVERADKGLKAVDVTAPWYA